MSCSSAIFGARLFWPRMKGWNGWNRFSTASRVSRRCVRPFGVCRIVVEAGVDPRLEILPAPLGVDVRRPGHRQRMHAVLVLQHVRGVEAVLAAGARHDAVVAAVVACGAGRTGRAAGGRARPSRSCCASPRRSGRRRRRRRRRSGWSPSRCRVVCLNSTAEFGRWLEITQLRQKRTLCGRP